MPRKVGRALAGACCIKRHLTIDADLEPANGIDLFFNADIMLFVSRFTRNQINKKFSRVPQYNWSVTKRELTAIEVVSRKDKSLGDIDDIFQVLFLLWR